ncbi:hypothetical protein D3C87_1956820 [compost metagenome]
MIDPVRVRPVEIAVGVNRLRLDPDAELHTQCADFTDQLIKALRELIRVHAPVA